MLKNLKVLGITQKPDTLLLYLVDIVQILCAFLLILAIVFVLYLAYFLQVSKRRYNNSWQAMGCPSLLRHNKAVFDLLFRTQKEIVPEALKRPLLRIKVLVWLVVLLLLLALLLMITISLLS